MAFYYPKDLKRHLLKHSDPQFFCSISSCKGAKKGFRREDKLKNHTKKVHGSADAVELYPCERESCSETFRSNYDRLRHERCNHGKIVYKCGFVSCKKGTKEWNRLDNLRIHIKKQHRGGSVDRWVVR
jgi:predicted small metal-binding protein